MPLPLSPLAKGSVDIAGEAVAFRSMSRAEALRLRDYEGQTGEAEAFIVSAGTGVSVEEARMWFEGVDSPTGATLIDAILVLSGLKSPPKSPSNKPSNGA